MSYLVLVWQLICFKKGPQDLPWSALLLVLLELATVVLITPANHEVLHVLAAEQLWSHSSWPAALALSFIQQSLYLVFAYLLLQKLNKAERWLKSMLALASSQVFLLVLLLLVSKLALPFLSFVLNIWSLAVAGHIYRHSLDMSISRGLWLHLALNLVVALTVALVFSFCLAVGIRF